MDTQYLYHHSKWYGKFNLNVVFNIRVVYCANMVVSNMASEGQYENPSVFLFYL